jgi:hypothetical protein
MANFCLCSLLFFKSFLRLKKIFSLKFGTGVQLNETTMDLDVEHRFGKMLILSQDRRANRY